MVHYFYDENVSRLSIYFHNKMYYMSNCFKHVIIEPTKENNLTLK